MPDEISLQTNEALAARQVAALRNVLSVISDSRANEQPVFDTILENACALCNAPLAGLILGTPDDAVQTLAAHTGMFAAAIDLFASGQMKMDPNLSYAARSILEGRLIAFDDMADSDLYRAGSPVVRSMVDTSGIRSVLFVPLIRDGAAIGNLTLFRREISPFDPSEIALVEAFAAQAVIAVENVRQFREVQTRLEREQASAEILAVISQSRDDEQPVLETIVRNAAALTHAYMVGISLTNAAGTHLSYAATWGPTSTHFPPGFQFDLSGPLQVAVTVREARTIHKHDLADDPLYEAGDPVRRLIVDEVGIRTFLTVPLIKNGVAFGCLNLNRDEVRAFTADEIKLVETFAAQAVIAIENVRQFREIQTRLERETASSEVLEIISTSRDDDLPVFRKITQAVSRLCNAPLAYICVLNEARTHVSIPAQIGARPVFAERLARFCEPVESDWLMAVKATLNRQVIRIDNLAEDDLYGSGNEYRVNMVDEEGMRSVLVVPLVSRTQGVGCIFLYRREIAPFSDAEVEVVRSFAAQAVIAIENVRQFRQLEARLAREAASRDILQIISQSRGDDTPVFDAILSNAARLCRAPMAWLLLTNETQTVMTLAAYHGLVRRALELGSTWSINRDETQTGLGTALFEARSVQDEDLAESEAYRAGDPSAVQLVDEEGLRTRLSVPLVSGGRCIGVIVLSRREVSPFSEEDAGLVDTFAEQAVIAIENVRQYKALEALNAELGDRVERQVGEIERMGKLKRFLPAAVADTVISSGSEDMLKSHRALLGVLFCDIRGFTAFCETAEPEETIEVLQTYHEEMGKLINAHCAGVDHRMGDGIMVLFNDPVPCDDPAGTAVRLAQAMQARMAELCAMWKRLGHRLGFGVGISLGYATVGMVGYEGRSDYTASGTAVNLAARLCDLAEDGDILLSARAAIAVEDNHPVEVAGQVTLKGIREPVEVFRLKSDK